MDVKENPEMLTFVHLWECADSSHCGKQYGGSFEIKNRITM